MKANPSICIIGRNVCGALHRERRGLVGGVEHQAALMARWLSGNGFTVSLLTWEEGGSADELVDGIRVIKICRSEEGVPGIGSFLPPWMSLYRAMARADADIYYHYAAESSAGLAAAWCQHQGRMFVYSVASDAACEKTLSNIAWLYCYGLSRTNWIITQTQRQQRMLKDGFGIDSLVLPMPCPNPPPEAFVTDPPSRRRIVWLGEVSRVKRLGWLLDVAALLPDIQFEVALADLDALNQTQGLRRRARSIPNVLWLGTVRRDCFPAMYQRATCLCCTSPPDGLPNSFLEAWSYGRPVVTSFDPDDLIAHHKLGIVARDVAGLARGIRSLVEAPELWRELSSNARHYAASHHVVDVAMPRFASLFQAIWNGQALHSAVEVYAHFQAQISAVSCGGGRLAPS